MTRKKGLGRGLSALIAPGLSAEAEAGAVTGRIGPVADAGPVVGQVVQVPLDRIRPGAHQARTRFDEESLAKLADSIRDKGVLVPLLARRTEDGFELIAGERRWRAAKMAGVPRVPVIVRREDDEAVHELSLIENLQREDLNPIEEATGYRKLMDRFGYTQETLAKRLGRDRSTIANLVRLLKLPAVIRDDLAEGALSMGHARALIPLASERDQIAARDRVVGQGLSVRATEQLVARMTRAATGRGKRGGLKAAGAGEFPYPWVLERMRGRLATKITVKGDGEKGVIEIHYFSAGELSRIVDLIGK